MASKPNTSKLADLEFDGFRRRYEDFVEGSCMLQHKNFCARRRKGRRITKKIEEEDEEEESAFFTDL